MYRSLDKIKQDKTLLEINETGSKVTEIVRQIAPSSLSEDLVSIRHRIEKFNLTLEAASETAQEISKNASSKSFLKVVADYAQTHVPSSEREINEKLEIVKRSTLDKLEKNGVPKELIAEATLILDKNIELAKSEMIKCLNK